MIILLLQVVITIKTAFFGGFRSLTGQLSGLAELRNVSSEVVDGDVIVHGFLDRGQSLLESPPPVLLQKMSTPSAQELIDQWSNYASSSASVYKRLYPEATSSTGALSAAASASSTNNY